MKLTTLVKRQEVSDPTGFLVADKWNPGTRSDRFFFCHKREVCCFSYTYHVPYVVILHNHDFGHTSLVGCKIDLRFHGIIRDLREVSLLKANVCYVRKYI